MTSVGRSRMLSLSAAMALLVSGCAGPPEPVPVPVPVPAPEKDLLLPAGDQRRALELEAGNNYVEALHYWQQAQKLVNGKIATLSGHLEELADSFATQGVSYYDRREADKALESFIRALRFDPANDVALDYLKHEFRPGQTVSYIVKAGDTFASIAEAVYGSASDAFIIEHFTDAAAERDLVPGRVLQVPVLESFYSPAILAYRRDILKARQRYSEKDYRALLPLAQDLVRRYPRDDEASFLLNSALIGLGETLRNQGRYDEAADVLAKVDPAFKNVTPAVNELRRLHEQTLQHDQSDRNRRYFERSQRLMSQKRYVEARDALKDVDPDYPGVRQARQELQKEIETAADRHYKQGVRFFVEDNLPAAIREWEKTLYYDPGHEKASDYLDKARELLRKVEAL